MNENIKPKVVGNVYKAEWVRGTFGGTVYDAEQIAPTLTFTGGGGVLIIYEREHKAKPNSNAVQQ